MLVVTILLSSIWTANSFENVWLLTQGGPSDATMVFPVLAYFGMQSAAHRRGGLGLRRDGAGARDPGAFTTRFMQGED